MVHLDKHFKLRGNVAAAKIGEFCNALTQSLTVLSTLCEVELFELVFVQYHLEFFCSLSFSRFYYVTFIDMINFSLTLMEAVGVKSILFSGTFVSFW